MKKIFTAILGVVIFGSCHKDNNSNPLLTPGSPGNDIYFVNQGAYSYTMYIKGINEGVIGGHSTQSFLVNTGTYTCEVVRTDGGKDETFSATVTDVQGVEIDFE